MAEAAALTRASVLRGALLTDDGLVLRCRVVIPRPSRCARTARRTLTSLRLSLFYSVWPITTPTGFLFLTFLFAAIVARAPVGSWATYTPLVNVLWRATHLPPRAALLSTPVEVALLAGALAATCILVLAALQRCALRVLLRDHRIVLETRAPTLRSRVWLGAVRALTGGKPRMLQFESALPMLALPALRDTIRRYIASESNLQSPAELAVTADNATDFIDGWGPTLHALLVAKSYVVHPHSDLWLRYVYLRGRSPLTSSNYYALDSTRFVPTGVQTARAAQLMHAFARTARDIENGLIAPVLVVGAVPLCMAQYEKAFGTTRLPGRDMDELHHVGDAQHMAVSVGGAIFAVPVYARDGSPHSAHSLEAALVEMQRDAAERPPRSSEAALASLTSLDRSAWAIARERHLGEGLNKRSLARIEGAIMFVALVDDAPPMLDWTGRAKTLLAGATRAAPWAWLDKSLCLCVFSNAMAGLNAEHSWADAPVVAHIWERVVMSESAATGSGPDGLPRPPINLGKPSPYGDDGHVRAVDAVADGCSGRARSARVEWARLAWALSADAEAAVADAFAGQARAAAQLELRVLSSQEDPRVAFGKGFIKRCRVSPDAFVQAAMQLAMWRDFAETDGVGRFAATYEATTMRLFKKGRTETVRPCTAETCAFVRLMQEGTSPCDQLAALRAAAVVHVRNFQAAMLGAGVDRHLFALACAAAAFGIESPFLTAALSTHWLLSTSQQPQSQETRYSISDPRFADRISAGGGFTAVSLDGYGVSYMMSASEDEMFFHVSATSGRRPSVARFTRILLMALADMKDVLERALAEGA